MGLLDVAYVILQTQEYTGNIWNFTTIFRDFNKIEIKVVLFDLLKIFHNLFVQMTDTIFVYGLSKILPFISYGEAIDAMPFPRTYNGTKPHMSTFTVTTNHLVG